MTKKSIRAWPADEVVRWKISRLSPYGKNPKKHPPEQIDLIARSIARFGFVNPILVDGDSKSGEIIAGHGRVLAAEKLGLTELPVILAKGWTSAEKRAYRIADNELGSERLAPYDQALLRVELTEVNRLKFDDMPLMGFGTELLRLKMGEPGAMKTSSGPPPSKFQILIECSDEKEQTNILGQLQKTGIRCRALIA